MQSPRHHANNAIAAVASCLFATACGPPFAQLTIEDPDELADTATAIAIGTELYQLESRALEGAQFPISVTVTAPNAGDYVVWADAIGPSGLILARGRTTATLSRGGGGRAALQLGAACNQARRARPRQHRTGMGSVNSVSASNRVAATDLSHLAAKTVMTATPTPTMAATRAAGPPPGR